MSVRLISKKHLAKSRFNEYSVHDLSEQEKQDIIQLATNILANAVKPGVVIKSPQDVVTYLRLTSPNDREIFGVMFLNSRNAVIAHEILFRGTIDTCTVYPRVVVQWALKLNASKCLVYHNHPSGETAPSKADIGITRSLHQVLLMFDIRLVDHLIVTHDGHTSLQALGMIG